MERRKEPRLRVSQPVAVTVLGLVGMPPMSGYSLDMSGSGLKLHVPRPIPCGSPVKVETKNMLFLGEVSRCEPDTNGYVVGLIVLHSLSALGELDRLNRALLGEDERKRKDLPQAAPVRAR